MTHDHPDPSLLEPSLSSEHDLQGFRQPWNPSSVAMAAFFCGPLGGGYLVAKNFERLGLRGRFVPTMAAFVGLFVVIVAVSAVMIGMELDADASRVRRSFTRYGAQFATVVFALLFLRAQRRRFRIYEAADLKPASLWGPGFAALLIGGAIHFGVLMLVVLLVQGPNS